MNAYPSWIHRIPEMIETLALADRERIDRQTVERLFDLRKTAAFQLLRRMLAGSARASALALGRGASNPHPRAHRSTTADPQKIHGARYSGITGTDGDCGRQRFARKHSL
jgi:hypothetical protein